MSPIFTMCMRPTSINPELFINRKEDYLSLKNMLKNFLEYPKLEDRRLLVQGDRGNGKSILAAKVLKDLKQEIDFMLIKVDGRENADSEELLRNICEKLCDELEAITKEETVLLEVGYIRKIYSVNKITMADAKIIAQSLEGTIKTGIGLFNIFSFASAIKGGETDTTSRTESLEITIDSTFLRKLLETVLSKIVDKEGKEILLFIDNLDQIRSTKQIDEFVREILKLKKFPIVVTLRSE
ncbi:MAG: P-loop NTPase fold protein [Methanosarcinales archaeon]